MRSILLQTRLSGNSCPDVGSRNSNDILWISLPPRLAVDILDDGVCMFVPCEDLKADIRPDYWYGHVLCIPDPMPALCLTKV